MASTTSKKFKGSFAYKAKVDDSWFKKDMFKGIIQKLDGDEHNVFCLICRKTISIAHQGEKDLKRHCDGSTHSNKVSTARLHKDIRSITYKKDSDTDKMARLAEVRFTGFLAEHNLPIASADHLAHLIRSSFPDSKVAQAYQNGKTKASCILNRAIKPDLHANLTNLMKTTYFSLATDGSNDQNLEKMNPVTVRIFDINQHKVVTQFFDMCQSKSSTAKGIFESIDNAMMKNDIPWEHCMCLGVDNTSVNIGRHNSLIVEFKKKNPDCMLMGCPCHIAHNTASHGTKAFCKALNDNFNVEDFLVDLYFHFDWSSKRKNLFAEYCSFCDQEYAKIIKFHSVRWLGLSECLTRTLRLFPSLRSYFLSQDAGIKDQENTSRLERLVKLFSNPMLEIYCNFLNASLPCLINLNLFLQRTDPVIHLMYDALFDTSCMLLGRFMKPEFVKMYRDGKLTTSDVENSDNYLNSDDMFVGVARNPLEYLYDDGEISQKQHDQFLNACLIFHKTCFLYAWKWFPLKNSVLKQARFLNFLDQKCAFESVQQLAHTFRRQLKFSQNEMNELEEEFLALGTISLDDFTPQELKEATLKEVDCDHDHPTYRIDVLWYYLHLKKISGTTKSKFEQLFKLASLLLIIVHSNAEEESVFSRVRKNLTPQRASLGLDGTLSSILAFQMNRIDGQPCHQYDPSTEVLVKAKKVTWEYNKEHGSK